MRLLLQSTVRWLVVIAVLAVDLQQGDQGLEAVGEVGGLQQGLLLRRLERQAHGQAELTRASSGRLGAVSQSMSSSRRFR